MKSKNIPKDKKGFNKLPEKIQEKISPKLAREFKMGGGMVDKVYPDNYFVTKKFPDRVEAGTPNIIPSILSSIPP